VGARLRLRIVPPAARFAMDAGGEALSVSGLPAGCTPRVEDAAPTVTDAAGSARVPLPVGGIRTARLRLRAAAPDGAETLDWQPELPATRAHLAGPDGAILETQREITQHDLRAWRVLPALVGQTDLSLRLVARPWRKNTAAGRPNPRRVAAVERKRPGGRPAFPWRAGPRRCGSGRSRMGGSRPGSSSSGSAVKPKLPKRACSCERKARPARHRHGPTSWRSTSTCRGLRSL
jgi:hypothetical protein